MKGIGGTWLGMVILYVLVVVLLLPWGVTWLFGREKQEPVEEEQRILEVLAPSKQDGLEEYIVGVVAAEMPVSFPMEALKAQAVAARTYTLRELGEGVEHINPADLGQAHLTPEEMETRWGENKEAYLEKVQQAVTETKGEIMTYEEEPILAVFHAQSGGQTEVSENIWSQSLPYLQSVDSKVDEQAPNFLTEVCFSAEEVAKKCGDVLGTTLSSEDILSTFSVLERSQAGYVTQVQVGKEIAKGRQVRQALSLRSTNFTIKKQGTNFVFTTKGYGHGGGMSQYGACFMAKEGKTYREILSHYYRGVSFSMGHS